jgi:hypothetical protein
MALRTNADFQNITVWSYVSVEMLPHAFQALLLQSDVGQNFTTLA